MKGSKYAVAVAQLEYHGALHPDAHMLFIKIQEEQPDIITEIMAHLSLNAGLKEWGTKVHNAVQYETNQLNLRNKFKPMHWKETDES